MKSSTGYNRRYTSSSREKRYQELGLEYLQQRQWYRELCYVLKPAKNQSPKYLFINISHL